MLPKVKERAMQYDRDLLFSLSQKLNIFHAYLRKYYLKVNYLSFQFVWFLVVMQFLLPFPFFSLFHQFESCFHYHIFLLVVVLEVMNSKISRISLLLLLHSQSSPNTAKTHAKTTKLIWMVRDSLILERFFQLKNNQTT